VGALGGLSAGSGGASPGGGGTTGGIAGTGAAGSGGTLAPPAQASGCSCAVGDDGRGPSAGALFLCVALLVFTRRPRAGARPRPRA